jgi:hypothetical protein
MKTALATLNQKGRCGKTTAGRSVVLGITLEMDE